MRKDGFHADIDAEVADRAQARLAEVPDSYGDPTVIEITWREIVNDKPNLRREIGRIATIYSGGKTRRRQHISAALLSLYSVLEAASTSADFEEVIAGLPESEDDVQLSE